MDPKIWQAGLGPGWAGPGLGPAGVDLVGPGLGLGRAGLVPFGCIEHVFAINEKAANIFSTMVPGSFICFFWHQITSPSAVFFRVAAD